MDDLDLALLKYLRDRARDGSKTPTFAKCGEKVGLGQNAARKRLKRLKEAGYFKVDVAANLTWNSVIFVINGHECRTLPRRTLRGRNGHGRREEFGFTGDNERKLYAGRLYCLDGMTAAEWRAASGVPSCTTGGGS